MWEKENIEKEGSRSQITQKHETAFEPLIIFEKSKLDVRWWEGKKCGDVEYDDDLRPQ